MLPVSISVNGIVSPDSCFADTCTTFTSSLG